MREPAISEHMLYWVGGPQDVDSQGLVFILQNLSLTDIIYTVIFYFNLTISRFRVRFALCLRVRVRVYY